jgi:tetratricopeptide (TPR) repeat protein
MNDQEKTYQEAMSLGHSAAWDQKWEEAVKYYRRAVQAAPGRVQGINNLGLAYFQLNKFTEAEACYKQSVKLSKDDPLPVERLAQIYERTGRIKLAADYSMTSADLYLKIKDADKAIENWARVTRMIPEHLKAHSRLAIVHERLGHTKQAVREYISVAALLQDVGQVSEAIQTVEKAIRIAPDNREARQALELVRSNKTLPKPVRQRGDTGSLTHADEQESAQEALIESTSIARQGPDPIGEARQKALTELAGLLFDVTADDLEDPDSTRPSLKGVFSRSKGDELDMISKHLGLAIDLQTRAQDEKALKELKKAVEIGLDVPSAYFNLGLLYHKQDKPEKAHGYLQRAINHPSFALASRLLIAKQFFLKDRLQEAVVEYLEALQEADISVVAEDQRDNLRAQYDPLIESFGQKMDRTKLRQLCGNIEDLLARQDWRDHVVKARRQLPSTATGVGIMPLAEILTEASDTGIVEAIARINEIARKGYLRSAMEESFMLLTSAPTYLPLHIHMAELMLRMENTKAAVEKFTVVAEAYAIRGEGQRATNLLMRVVEISPMDFNARTRLIKRLTEMGEVDKAIHEYIKLADVQYRLAQLDHSRSTYENAFRLAQQTNADVSWSVRILRQMADIDLQRLDWKQALRVYEQLRTLIPEDELTRTRLIELNVRLGRQKQAAAELDNFISYLSGKAKHGTAAAYLEKLAEENEEMAFARSKMADYLAKLGRVEESIEQWDKVAEIMVVRGDFEKAKEAIRAILLLNPPNADQYRAALQRLG